MRSVCAVRRPSSTVRRLPSAVCRPPSTVIPVKEASRRLKQNKKSVILFQKKLHLRYEKHITTTCDCGDCPFLPILFQ
ncbi:MAG TPA: hypothetical protein ENJ53_03500 [Phaeodactylibacter sp.]|nr:hypothetical protein [Phaeodactylibacter sp.]